jgi:hypothetical protein
VVPGAVVPSLLGLAACSSVEMGERQGTASELGQVSAAASVATTTSLVDGAPLAVAFALDLDGQSYQLSLERSPPPTSQGYQAYRRTREGTLVPLPPADLRCTYRGVTAPRGASGDAGFAALDVCSRATGLEAGRAARGVIRAGGRFWELWPDPADHDLADGVDHFAQPLQRAGGVSLTPEPVRHVTLTPLESEPPRLEFREGTDAETKYIDLIVVSDAARVAALGGDTEARTLQFVDTMNALLEASGITPRLRVTLRAQVLFDEDPYSATRVDNEVDNVSLLNAFLAWGLQEELPAHDEHMLLSGLDFVGGVVGFAGVSVACRSDKNGLIVQAGGASGGFAVLSAVHEIGHTVGMDHDDGTDPDCPEQGFIMAAVGCGNCPGAEEEQFSKCSIQQFQNYLAGPDYTRCADDVPLGGARSCGNGVVEAGETCDCGASDCGDLDPCCDGAACQLNDGAECSDFNDGCCQNCAVVGAEAAFVCRAQRSSCDIAEVCPGGSKDCPSDAFQPAGGACQDAGGYDGACYFGDCRTRGGQCEQIAESQAGRPEFDDVGAPGPRCDDGCTIVACGDGPSGCLNISGPTLIDGVPCNDGTGQCVNRQCVTTIDQCPFDPDKNEPGTCGCGRPEEDRDADGTFDCIDQCPDDPTKSDPEYCGCAQLETDRDGDRSPDCVDLCPDDPTKSDPEYCGCAQLETDSDNDGSPDCVDECPAEPRSSRVGACGCGVPEVDSDLDGSPDCVDECPTDATHTLPPCTSGLNASFRSSSDGCTLTTPGAPAANPALPLLACLALALTSLRRRR